MDRSAVDRLTKTLAEPHARRGLSRLLGGLAVGGPLALLGTTESAARKKRCPPCKTRKKGGCKGKRPDGTACAGGTCQGGACVKCVPEPVTETCAGAPCGPSRTNTCGQVVVCPCPSGLTCLPNGTCARPCVNAGSCAGCAPNSQCLGFPTVEGQNLCLAPNQICSTLQVCNPANPTTTGCAPGYACIPVPCGSFGSVPLCVAVAVCPPV